MDIGANLGQQRLAGARARHRHVYEPMTYQRWQELELESSDQAYECKCGKVRDPLRARTGKSSRRLGHDQERRIERVYGPRKVGEFGDAIDLIGRDFMWQSKATRTPYLTPPGRGHDIWSLPKDYVSFTRPIAAMLMLRQDRAPLLIRSWVRQGIPTTDVIIVRGMDWSLLHDAPAGARLDGYVAMTGQHFLDVHGRDEP